jgi:hypothetical protein
MDNYARLAGKLAVAFRPDAVVGRSPGGNVTIEMLAAGPLSLVSAYACRAGGQECGRPPSRP